MPISEAYNMDCMEYMEQFPDNAFDLAIVDPPYGLGNRLINGGKKGKMGTLRNLSDDKLHIWDSAIPEKKYFIELKRISIKQIIWGCNYFLGHLQNTDGLIIWDKMNGTNPMADAEIAWQNIKSTTRIFRWHHFSGGNKNKKIHPTQKPVALYKWLLKNYAKEGDKILDTHLGSGSSRIAAWDMGFDFYATELDADYFAAQEKRFNNFKMQGKLFA